MVPLRFSTLTLNLWNTEKWDTRRPVFFEFLRRFSPDICCFQELRKQTVNEIDKAFDEYTRVHDNFAGWVDEGNIYYKKKYFKEMDHGEVFLDMPEKNRRLFWVRLEVLGQGQSVLLATVHLTHQNNADEQRTGMSYRHSEALKIAEWFNGRSDKDLATILTGDFNDPVHPARILSNEGLRDSFQELGLLSPPTFPCLPTSDELHTNEAIDKIMSAGKIRPLTVSVPGFYFNGSAMSDHWPVLAVFELKDRN